MLADINRAIDNLSMYHWLEPEHATVFQAIRAVAKGDHLRLRAELPAQATRMGFPDVDWPQYFTRIPYDERAPLDELASQLMKFGARDT